MIPLESISSLHVTTAATGDEDEALRFAKALIADPAVDVTRLENALRSVFGGSHTRWVFPIAELETFNVTAGFFGVITLKMPRESIRRLVIRDKGGKSSAKAFFETRSQHRAAS